MTNQFDELQNHSKAMGETNDCTVKAIAAACGVSYEEAHAACKKHGRRPRRGMMAMDMIRAAQSLGFEVEQVSPQEKINQYRTRSGRSLKTVTMSHPEKFPEAWQGSYFIFCRGHVAGIVDGINHDWTNGRQHKAKMIYRIKNPRHAAPKAAPKAANFATPDARRVAEAFQEAAGSTCAKIRAISKMFPSLTVGEFVKIATDMGINPSTARIQFNKARKG